MKITKTGLRQIIKEEIQKLNEGKYPDDLDSAYYTMWDNFDDTEKKIMISSISI